MAQDNDLFAPPSQEELDLFGAPTEEELALANPTLLNKVGTGLQEAATDIAAPVMDAGPGIVQPILETGLDAARGVAKGLTLNSIDELGGLASAGVEALYNKFNPTDVKLRQEGFKIDEASPTELYRKNQEDIQKELEMSEERSPVVDVVGQIGGGMTSGSMLGSVLGLGKTAQASRPLLDIASKEGKMRAGIELLKRGGTTYAKAAPAIAAEAALSSKEGGVFSEEERAKLAEDTVGGLAFGLPTALGLQAVTDLGIPAVQKTASDIAKYGKGLVEDSPLLRQMRVGYNYGAEGINPKSTSTQLAAELGTTNLAELDNTRTKKLMEQIYKADDTIGKAVGQSLDDATKAGKIVNISPDTQRSLSQLRSLSEKYPELADNTRAEQIFAKIAETKGQISPIDTRDLIDYVDAYIGKFKSATNKTPLEQSILSNLINTRKDFSNTLKDAIPEYKAAANRMASFRTAVPETLIARSRPVDVDGRYFGSLKNQDKELFDSIKALNQGTTKAGSGSSETRTAYVNFIKGLKGFEAEEAQRLTDGTITSQAMPETSSIISKTIKANSDDAVARGSMDALSPQTGVGGILKEGLIGAGAETGRSLALTASNKAGLMARYAGKASETNSIAKLGRGIYNAPNDAVDAIASKLKAVPGLEKYGNTLSEAISSGNNNKKNQALFTIMQNPSARAIVGTEEDEN